MIHLGGDRWELRSDNFLALCDGTYDRDTAP